MYLGAVHRRRACPPEFVRALSTTSVVGRHTTTRVAAAGRASPTPSSTDAYYRQRRTEWVFVGVAGSAAAFGTWYYWNKMDSRNANEPPRRKFSLSASAPTSFTIPVRSKDTGQPMYRIITPLTEDQVNARLHENEHSTRVERPPGACLVARYDTNSVASNATNEDRHAEVIVERDRGIDELPMSRRDSRDADSQPERVRGDLCFFTVMDGHGGDFTSQVLSRKLVAFVALELDKVFKETGEYADMARSKQSVAASVWNTLFGSRSATNGHRLAAMALDGDPDIVTRALIKGFRGLDKEIINTPLELLKQYELSLASVSKKHSAGDDAHSLSSLAHSIWPSSLGQPKNTSFSTMSQGSAFESILPAISGSCALMVYVDSARHDLYVASTGDSRAVAGYWDERAGRWEVEALSVDQTGRNPAEVRRIQREHPPEEAPYVIQRGRVLGGLEPTRAFGDSRYKWDRRTQQRIAEAFLPDKYRRGVPRALKTPPYVTAEPLVQWRRLRPLADTIAASAASVPASATIAKTTTKTTPEATAQAMPDGVKLSSSTSTSPSPATTTLAAPSSSSKSPTRELRFIIMATDGLWDLMSNEEAVGLVAGHLAGMRGTIRADDLQRMCFEPLSKTVPDISGSGPASDARTSAKDATATSSEVPQQHGPAHPLLKSPSNQQTFTFEDDNLSTHLVRNALGGAARERVAGLLAIPSPESRRFRDDITVNVILFHTAAQASSHHLHHQNHSSTSASSSRHSTASVPNNNQTPVVTAKL